MAKPTRFTFGPSSGPAPVAARLEPIRATSAFGTYGAGDLIGYNVFCGWADCGARRPDDAPRPDRLGFLLAPVAGVTGEWVLDHETGYRGYPDSGYHVMRDQDEKRARRWRNGWSSPRIAPRKVEPWVATKYLSVAPDSVVGQRPVPPCVVFCPRCKRPNDVAIPG